MILHILVNAPLLKLYAQKAGRGGILQTKGVKMIEDRIYPTENGSAFGGAPEEIARKEKIKKIFGPKAALNEVVVVPVKEPETEKS